MFWSTCISSSHPQNGLGSLVACIALPRGGIPPISTWIWTRVLSGGDGPGSRLAEPSSSCCPGMSGIFRLGVLLRIGPRGPIFQLGTDPCMEAAKLAVALERSSEVRVDLIRRCG